MCSHVPAAHPTGQRAQGQRPEGQQVTAPALGRPVKVIGDAPAQKASLGGTLATKPTQEQAGGGTAHW